MANYRVKWKEIRVHYVDVEAEDEFDAIELAQEFSYEDTASETSWYDEYHAEAIQIDEYGFAV